MIQNSRCLDIKDLLVEAGIVTWGGTDRWACYVGNFPADQNDAVCLVDMPGQIPNPKWLIDYPVWKITVRSEKYNDGYVKMQEIRSKLLGLHAQVINGTRYDGVFVIADVFYLQQDNQKRSIFVSTWRAIIEPVDDGARLPL